MKRGINVLQTKEILTQIEKRKNQLFQELELPNEEADFFEEFMLKFNKGIINNILNLDMSELLVAFLTSKSNRFSFSDVQEKVNFLGNFTNNTNISSVFAAMDYAIKEMSIEEVEKILSDTKMTPRKLFKLNIPIKLKGALGFLMGCKQTENIHMDNILTLVRMEPEAILKGTSLVSALLDFKEDHENYTKAIKDINKNYQIKISSKKEQRAVANILGKEYVFSEITKSIDEITKYGQRVIAKEKSRQKRIKKELKAYAFLASWIDRNQQEREISKIPDEVKRLSDQNLKLQILRYIYLHNQKEYQIMAEKYEDLSKNCYSQYQILFQKYGIDLDQYSFDLTKNIAEVEIILATIKKLEITNPDEIMQIISSTNLDITTNIEKLISKGYITTDFIKDHQDIFNHQYLNLITNIELLKSKNLSISNIQKLQSSLVEDPKIIHHNLEILENYYLFSSLPNASSHQFLCETTLEHHIDSVLELGFEQFLETDLGLLDKNEKSFKRTLILKRLNIPIDTLTELYSILDNRKFLIPNDDLDDYIFNMISYINISNKDDAYRSKEELIAVLNNEQTTLRTYRINGIAISKNKVKRNLECINHEILSKNEQLNCVLSNSILDKNEYEQMYDYLFQPKKQKK